MRCKLRINMSKTDQMVRFYLSIVLMVLAVSTSNYLFLICTIVLIYTALKRRCFIYGLFRINKNISKDSYYEELFIKHNKYKIAIYENDGKIVYKNDKFKEFYEDINYIQDLVSKVQNIQYDYIEDEELNICYI